MKHLKQFENIDWDWNIEEKPKNIKIPYIKNNITYGYNLSKYDKFKFKFKFKLEDIVISSYVGKTYGHVGHVVDYTSFAGHQHCLICFITNIRGHSDYGIPFGHGWWVDEIYLKKYDKQFENIN